MLTLLEFIWKHPFESLGLFLQQINFDNKFTSIIGHKCNVFFSFYQMLALEVFVRILNSLIFTFIVIRCLKQNFGLIILHIWRELRIFRPINGSLIVLRNRRSHLKIKLRRVILIMMFFFFLSLLLDFGVFCYLRLVVF